MVQKQNVLHVSSPYFMNGEILLIMQVKAYWLANTIEIAVA